MKTPLGTTGKFQKANLLASCQGRLFKVGWIRFASDGGLYAQVFYSAPVTCVGEAVQASGLLQAKTREDVADRPPEERKDVHLSLHPTGIVHVRSGKYLPLVERNFGQWLPVKKPCLLGHLFSPALRYLDTQDKQKFKDRVFPVDCLDSGIRATITLLPKDCLPTQPTLLGMSPKYNVGVTIAVIKPATPGVYFVTDLGTPTDNTV